MDFREFRSGYASGVILAYAEVRQTLEWCLRCLRSNLGVSSPEAFIVISRIREELGDRMTRELAERLAELEREFVYAGWEGPEKGEVGAPLEKFKRKWWMS